MSLNFLGQDLKSPRMEILSHKKFKLVFSRTVTSIILSFVAMSRTISSLVPLLASGSSLCLCIFDLSWLPRSSIYSFWLSLFWGGSLAWVAFSPAPSLQLLFYFSMFVLGSFLFDLFLLFFLSCWDLDLAGWTWGRSCFSSILLLISSESNC